MYTFSKVMPTSMGYQFCSCTEYNLINGVKTVYGSKSGLGHYAPVYSKAGDTAAVYTIVPGESFLNAEDDRRVKINLPDGYSTEDIKNIIGSKNSIVIEFNDDMMYTTVQMFNLEHTANMIVGVFGIYYKGDDFRKVGIG